ncbi:MAG: hypothetical protein IPI49_07170 [Myxococcales bacterium]|nr:hypothetical protein [Myxococcales bacterium]
MANRHPVPHLASTASASQPRRAVATLAPRRRAQRRAAQLAVPYAARWLCLAGLGLGACQLPSPPAQLDPAAIWVSSEVTMRTDTVGQAPFDSQASFVLVDAENRSSEAAMVTLAGTFRDERGASLSKLRAESLWVPAGGRRMFALVDKERKPRPGARGAQLLVSGAKVLAARPVMRVIDERSFDDFGKTVTVATLVNDADRPGKAMVFAAFYDARQKPMARPFTSVPIEAQGRLPLRFVGPQGSRSGMIFLGDLVY